MCGDACHSWKPRLLRRVHFRHIYHLKLIGKKLTVRHSLDQQLMESDSNVLVCPLSVAASACVV